MNYDNTSEAEMAKMEQSVRIAVVPARSRKRCSFFRLVHHEGWAAGCSGPSDDGSYTVTTEAPNTWLQIKKRDVDSATARLAADGILLNRIVGGLTDYGTFWFTFSP